jgi:hypothetical protein
LKSLNPSNPDAVINYLPFYVGTARQCQVCCGMFVALIVTDLSPQVQVVEPSIKHFISGEHFSILPPAQPSSTDTNGVIGIIKDHSTNGPDTISVRNGCD